ncbi:PhoH family protein [Helicobacter mustelae]|uniref:Putative PhoH-family protein n=1 Tax=Helicobacter mustelae (strain ATCC 43772 / CCUG 25715 / CIP 103759 / LMG 18044 / NCTC 12198 / R85-136P) TaxID=679897 RepID=D3UHI9_HELM1|nr:PhoH family protein [Helicobacter mustelae]CBG39961.1 Putative PhoH-family protein [Helicobacter mustelae 12198]SQH71473.1 PhoH-family protein [Helicobacter mustelae]
MSGVLLDTSIILDDVENVCYVFQSYEKQIFISDIVIEELDRHKNFDNQNGYFAREFFRCIKEENAPIYEGAPPMQGDFFKVVLFEKNSLQIPIILIHRQKYRTSTQEYGLNDSKIAEIAQDYHFTLLSNDIALKIRLLARGVESKSLYRDRVEDPKKIDFWQRFSIHKEENMQEALSQDPQFLQMSNWGLIEIAEKDSTGSSSYLTGRKFYGIKNNGKLELLNFDEILKSTQPYILPMNLEQKMLYALLIHPQNTITIVSGSTGSGKTLMALQAGIHLVKNKVVDGILYLRNTVTANDSAAELGYRKGDEQQKLHYFMYPLFSAVNFTIHTLQAQSLAKRIEYRGEVNTLEKEDATEYFLQKHKIEVIDIAHARGITISNKFVIFDEVQNASNATLKLIGTRIGENSRICFLGDWKQIDHPFLSKFRNGAVSLLQKALSKDGIAGIKLKQVIRSEVATFFEENF